MTTFDIKTSLGAICGVLIFAATSAGTRARLMPTLSILDANHAGLCVVTTMMTLEAAVPRADRAVVTASRTFARLLGASIGVAVAGSTITNRLSGSLDSLKVSKEIKESILNDPASIQHDLKAVLGPVVIESIVLAYVETFKMLFWIVTGLLLFAFVAAAILIRSHALAREDDEEQKEAAVVWLEEEKAKKVRKALSREETIRDKV